MDGSSDFASLVENRWDESHAAGLSAEQLLLYRSNLLGGDKRVTNYAGGNTSAKISMADPLTGAMSSVLWVKGSGGDLGSMKLDGFATLYMDKLLALLKIYRGPEREDEMVALYPHCTFNLNPRAASIDTPLHAYIDRGHVDHMHPDALIAIAATKDSEKLTRAIFGDEIGWLPWRRPGFELGMMLKRFSEKHPKAKGVVLEAHGLFTWADTSHGCYDVTIDVINKATAWLAEQSRGKRVFGGPKIAAADVGRRHEVAAALMPRIRGMISVKTSKVGHFEDGAAVLDYVGGGDLAPLAALGTSCPDHFLRTKIRPLVLPFDPARESIDALIPRIAPAVEAYRADYTAYYERCKRSDSPGLRDPNAVVYLVPGVGMLTFAANKETARVSAEYYVNAINVMRGATAVSAYVGLPEQEAFDIEYWLLEEAKLKRMPKAKSLAGKVALITGGAGGIGRAIAGRLLGEGAAVIICDIDRDVLAEAEADLKKNYGRDNVTGLWVNVTEEAAVIALFRDAALAFGGIDICVSNAGFASAAPFEDTSLELWQKNIDVLATGYFLITREAFRMMKAQGTGGSIIMVASKNSLVASAGASAYCVAKAAEVQLSRTLALEGAPFGIRSNVVNPDAVLRGSRIWQGEWREQRAAAYKAKPEELEEVYRQRSLLKRGVYPEDIAEAVAFFASEERSAKSTGNILNVDAGNVSSFTR